MTTTGELAQEHDRLQLVDTVKTQKPANYATFGKI